MLDARRVKDSTEKKINIVVAGADKSLGLKGITSRIYVLNMLLENKEILQRIEEYLEEDSIEDSLEDKELYILNVLDSVTKKNMFNIEKVVAFIEELIEITAKKSKLLCVTLTGMCNIHLIKEEYYDLSDVLRRVTFHLAEENSKRMRVGLENILKKFMPIVKKEDPQGFCEVVDILGEIYPIEKQYDLEDII